MLYNEFGYSYFRAQISLLKHKDLRLRCIRCTAEEYLFLHEKGPKSNILI